MLLPEKNIYWSNFFDLPRWQRTRLPCRIHKGHGFEPWVGIPVLWRGKSHGQRSLAGCTPWGHKRVGHSLVTKQKHKKFYIRETNFRSVQCEEQPRSYLKTPSTHFLVFSFSHQIDVIFFSITLHMVWFPGGPVNRKTHTPPPANTL